LPEQEVRATQGGPVEPGPQEVADAEPRASERGPPLDPVMPILDRLDGLLVAVNDLQLRERDGERALLFPGHLHEHLTQTHSSSGAMPTTSTSSPTRKGEV